MNFGIKTKEDIYLSLTNKSSFTETTGTVGVNQYSFDETTGIFEINSDGTATGGLEIPMNGLSYGDIVEFECKMKKHTDSPYGASVQVREADDVYKVLGVEGSSFDLHSIRGTGVFETLKVRSMFKGRHNTTKGVIRIVLPLGYAGHFSIIDIKINIVGKKTPLNIRPHTDLYSGLATIDGGILNLRNATAGGDNGYGSANLNQLTIEPHTNNTFRIYFPRMRTKAVGVANTVFQLTVNTYLYEVAVTGSDDNYVQFAIYSKATGERVGIADLPTSVFFHFIISG